MRTSYLTIMAPKECKYRIKLDGDRQPSDDGVETNLVEMRRSDIQRLLCDPLGIPEADKARMINMLVAKLDALEAPALLNDLGLSLPPEVEFAKQLDDPGPEATDIRKEPG